MPKRKTISVTFADVANMPISRDAVEAAEMMGTTAKYMRTHAEEYGGKLIAGQWRFPTKRLLAELGLEV